MKKTTLLAFSILSICSIQQAFAADYRTSQSPKPDVEINLDALKASPDKNTLVKDYKVSVVRDNADGSPFGVQSPADKARMEQQKKHLVKKKHKKKAVASTQKPVAEHTAPEVKVVEKKHSKDEMKENFPVIVSHDKKDQKEKPLPAIEALPSLPSDKQPDKNLAPSIIKAPGSQQMPLPAPKAKNDVEVVPLPALPNSLPADKNSGMNLPPEVKVNAPVTPPALPSPSTVTPPALPPLQDNKAASPATATPPALPVPAGASAKTDLTLPAIAPLPVLDKAPSTDTPPDAQVVFKEAETELPLSSSDKLDDIAAKLAANTNSRINIMAYASGSESMSVYPRRVSLARGLAVRNYLTAKNISADRINVKALGNKTDAGAANRVDIFIIK